MPYEIFHEAENNIVVRKYTGDITIEDITNAAKETWALKKKYSSIRFLSEFTNSRIVFSIDELIEFSEVIKSIGIDEMDRAAIFLENVESKELEVHQRIFEAGTRKGYLKIFFDRDEVVEWLCS